MEVKKFTSYEEIVNKIHLPSFQRDLNFEVVQNITTYILTRSKLNLECNLGVIDLCKFNNQLFLIDGRHRLKAIENAYLEKKHITFYAIIYTVSTQEEMLNIFVIRNSGTAVPDFILHPPDGKGQLLREINSYLRELPLVKIPKPGSKVNRPHLNLTAFMEYLSDSEFLIEINTKDEFVELFNKVNKKLRKKVRDEAWQKKYGITENMLEIVLKEEDSMCIGLCKSYTLLDDLL